MPPLVGVAVKVTEAPTHIVPDGTTAMLTDGTTDVVTTIVMEFEVAVAGEAQEALEVMITVTISPLFKVAEVKVDELVPALTPFTCH